jgi:flagellar biosynthesis/type III secretory pathway chaperone
MSMATDIKTKDAPLVEATVALMNDLTVLMEDELRLVAKQDVPAVQELLRRKHKLFAQYQANMKTLAARHACRFHKQNVASVRSPRQPRYHARN